MGLLRQIENNNRILIGWYGECGDNPTTYPLAKQEVYDVIDSVYEISADGTSVIAFLSYVGYSDVKSSRLLESESDEPYFWEAEFGGNNLPNCLVSINSKSRSHEFKISSMDSNLTILLKDPFELRKVYNNEFDIRVPILVDIVREGTPHSLPVRNELYHDVNNLWDKIESISTFVCT